MNTLPIKIVNRLYLLTIILIVIIGSIVQSYTFGWGLLATEIVLIFLPTLWVLRKNRINIRESMGFYKPRGSILLVTLMLGSGAWLVDSMIESLMVEITGYNIPTPANMLPTNIWQAALVFVGMVIAAPICEEFLFRGTIQRAYMQEKSGWQAISIASLLFVVYHLRLQGFVALIPIAFILGYVYWRTRSIIAVMIVHFANNLLATLVLLRFSLFPEMELPFPSLPAAAFGILMVVIGLVLLNRLTPTPEPTTTIEQEKTSGWVDKLQSAWPLAAAGLIFLTMAVLEVVGSTSFGILQLSSANMPEEANWRYELRHKGGDVVGQANCKLKDAESSYILNCDRSNSEFEARIDNSFFSSTAGSATLQASWKSEDLTLQYLNQFNRADEFTSTWTVQKIENQLRITVQRSDGFLESLDFPSSSFVEDEWAWRLMGLPFEQPQIWTITYINPLIWREKLESSGPQKEDSFIIIDGQETIKVPAGEFEAYKVSFGTHQTAWYAVESPHTLLKLEANVFDYFLLP